MVPTAMASSDKRVRNGKWIHFKRQTHFNKTKQETHFLLIMPKSINVLFKRMPLWKGSYDGCVLKEAAPGFLSGAFTDDFKEFILFIYWSQISAKFRSSPAGRFGLLHANSPAHLLLLSFTANMGLKDLCLF